MDFGAMNAQINDTVNHWLEVMTEYFSSLTQMEWYGWAAFAFGFLLFVLGIILL